MVAAEARELEYGLARTRKGFAGETHTICEGGAGTIGLRGPAAASCVQLQIWDDGRIS